ncbi:MAG: hemin uptake protein HemP [Fluviibacter sp.]
MASKSASSLAPRLLQVAGVAAPQKVGSPVEAVKRISSRTLLGQNNSLVIDHEGVSYVLRATRLGKLILTK